jgi:hypothetical protein
MIAIILNSRTLLYSFHFINNSEDQGIPSEVSYIPLGVWVKSMMR